MSSGDGRPPSDGDSGAAPDDQSAIDGGRPPGPTTRSPEESTPSPGEFVTNLPRRVWTADGGPYRLLREVLVNVAAVVLVGMLLFAVSGVWPPMVAVESGSMEPHMHKGDLVFVTEPGRYVPSFADDRGVVTYREARDRGYRTFGSFGSVVVYDNPTRPGPPIIHRAHFWVEAGENWYSKADPAALEGDNCAETKFCPAPHAGYVTKGDNNEHYDQVNGISGPVRPGWITGVAHVRVPYLGWIRLALSTLVAPAPAPVTAGPELAVASGAAPVAAGPSPVVTGGPPSTPASPSPVVESGTPAVGAVGRTVGPTAAATSAGNASLPGSVGDASPDPATA